MLATCTVPSVKAHLITIAITTRVPPDSAGELPLPRYALPERLREISCHTNTCATCPVMAQGGPELSALEPSAA
jgi:hypothetical protein